MPTLRELEEAKSDWRDDYRLNSMMRTVLRGEKKEATEQKAKDKELLDKWNINIDLVKENENDVKLAALYKYNTVQFDGNSDELERNEKRKQIETESIFNLNNKKIAIKDTSTEKSVSLVKSSSKQKGKIREEQRNGIKSKLSKSIQNQILSKTGFSLDNSLESLNSKSNNKEENCLLNIKNSIVKKQVHDQKKLESSQSSNLKEILATSKSTSVNPLVSNDYGDSSSSENS